MAGPAEARKGAGMPLTQAGCPTLHLPLPARLHLHMDCLPVRLPPSPFYLRNDTCLLESILTWTDCLLQVIFPKPGSGDTKESTLSTEQLVSHYLLSVKIPPYPWHSEMKMNCEIAAAVARLFSQVAKISVSHTQQTLKVT